MSEVGGNTQQSLADVLDGEHAFREKLQFTWQDLYRVGKHITETQWPQTRPPTVLETLPENIVLNERLQEILTWSLRSSKPVPELLTPDTSFEEVFVEASDGRSSTEGEDKIATLTPPKSDGSVRSTNSSAGKGGVTTSLFTRLRRLRQDVALKRAASVRHRETIAANAAPSCLTEVAPGLGECISCFEEYPKCRLTHLSCSHDYCKTCLHEVVVNAMKTESAFPPKCCLSEIPRKQILSCLDSQERDEYKAKSAEYSIPAGHRWYCPDPKCAKWIMPEKLHHTRRDHQVCPHCKTNICSMCRSLAHDGNEACPQDFGLESTLEIADSEGWRRCYSCRTMVELTTGCRHITCRCGAEFCYVCNARWRTCNCTEADKERRIAELRARREERTREQEEADAAAEADAEELAEAIRQIEQMELEETVRREEEERQRQLEEELMLARLEEERLLEEISRREAEEEMARQLRETLLTSSKEECQTMMDTLMQIIIFQHAALMSEHESRELQCVEKKETKQERHSGKVADHAQWLEDNIRKRRSTLQKRQTQELQALQLQAEEEEDDMFMQMHTYLKDKPNREAREMKMRDAFQKQQTERQEELAKRHREERKTLEESSYSEREGLRKATSMKLDPIIKEFQLSLRTLGSQIGADRKWFQMVSTRRIEMMKEHRNIVLRQIEGQEEPTGLTEELARTIELTLPVVDDGQPGSSGIDRRAAAFGAPSSTSFDALPEEEDMYGPSTGAFRRSLAQDRSPTMTTATLNGSSTIIDSMPGSYSASSAGSNVNNTNPIPDIKQSTGTTHATIKRKQPSGIVETSPATTIPTFNPAFTAFEVHEQRQPNYSHNYKYTQPQPQFHIPTIPPFNRLSPLTLQPSPSPDSQAHFHNRNRSVSPPTTATTLSSPRFSTSSSIISPISSKHSSTATDIEITDTNMNASSVTNANAAERPVRKGLFANRFRRSSGVGG